MRLIAGMFEGAPVEQLDSLERIATDTDGTIQGFDARYIVSTRHLARALELADRAIARGEEIADDRGVEIMLYAAGRRQIDRALELGLKEEVHPVVVLVDGGEEGAALTAVEGTFETILPLDETVGETDRIREFYDVTDDELRTGADLEALVLERVALLTIDK